MAILASACVLAGVLYGIVWGAGKKAVHSSDCLAGKSVEARLAPLARGQVAAFEVASEPRPFPDVSFQGPSGEPRRLADFRGRTILLNLWATWCIPCRQEMPTLDRLQARFGGTGFEVVAVDVDTARLDQRRPFLEKAGIRNLTFYADPTAEILRSLKESGPVIGLPTSFMLGKDGCELGAMLGPADWSSPDATALIAAAISGASGKT